MTAPLRALLLSGVGGPVLSAAVAALAVYFARQSAAQANALADSSAVREEERAKREETGRNLRAALTLATSENDRQRAQGLRLLRALYASGILDPEQRALAATSLAVSLEPLAKELTASASEVEVRESTSPPPVQEEGS